MQGRELWAERRGGRLGGGHHLDGPVLADGLRPVHRLRPQTPHLVLLLAAAAILQLESNRILQFEAVSIINSSPKIMSQLEGNVLLEPAAAMNQMLVLKCFINVDSRLKHVIRNIFTCDLYTLFTLHNVHTLCTMCSVYLVYHVYPAYLGCRVHPVCSAYRVPCLPCVPYVPYKPFVPKLCTKSIQSQYLMFTFSMSF